MTFGFYTEGMAPGRDTPHVANFRGVTADYFRAAGIPLQRGRFFNAGDRTGSAPVMLINEAMAAQYWRDANPLGQRIAITRGRTVIWREIVGVVGNVRHASLGAAPDPEMYMPYAHDPFPFMRIAVKSAERPDALAGAMRAAVWSVDRDQPVSRLRPMDEVIAASLAETRFQATLVGVFAALALALASVGLYGVMAYSVSQRVHEFGVRMALGADRSHILRIVLRQGLALATLGLALGLALSFLLTPLIPVELYGTAPGDPATLAAVAATLTLIALLASYVPARRAVSVDPLVVLGG
jgi:putative ABC transport system permease protein